MAGKLSWIQDLSSSIPPCSPAAISFQALSSREDGLLAIWGSVSLPVLAGTQEPTLPLSGFGVSNGRRLLFCLFSFLSFFPSPPLEGSSQPRSSTGTPKGSREGAAKAARILEWGVAGRRGYLGVSAFSAFCPAASSPLVTSLSHCLVVYTQALLPCPNSTSCLSLLAPSWPRPLAFASSL